MITNLEIYPTSELINMGLNDKYDAFLKEDINHTLNKRLLRRYKLSLKNACSLVARDKQIIKLRDIDPTISSCDVFTVIDDFITKDPDSFYGAFYSDYFGYTFSEISYFLTTISLLQRQLKLEKKKTPLKNSNISLLEESESFLKHTDSLSRYQCLIKRFGDVKNEYLDYLMKNIYLSEEEKLFTSIFSLQKTSRIVEQEGNLCMDFLSDSYNQKLKIKMLEIGTKY